MCQCSTWNSTALMICVTGTWFSVFLCTTGLSSQNMSASWPQSHTYNSKTDIDAQTCISSSKRKIKRELCSSLWIIRAHAEPRRQSLASWEQGSPDDASLFKSPRWAQSVSVDGIAPGDVHDLGGENSHGGKKKKGKKGQNCKMLVIFEEVKGQRIRELRFNQTSRRTVSHREQIRLQRRANANEITRRWLTAFAATLKSVCLCVCARKWGFD